LFKYLLAYASYLFAMPMSYLIIKWLLSL